MSLPAILTAAFAQLNTSSGWVTTETKLRHWTDVQPAERPYVAQALGPVELRTIGGAAVIERVRLDYWIYISHTDPAGPQGQLADRIDAILAAFAPPTGLDWQTLGGLVRSAAPTGTVDTDEGTLGTDAVAIVPVVVEV